MLEEIKKDSPSLGNTWKNFRNGCEDIETIRKTSELTRKTLKTVGETLETV